MLTAVPEFDDEVSHGTINVVLGNQRGMVALTDSMVTVRDHQIPEPGQKLFKLDERSVCTIAGLLAYNGPSHLYLASGALINEYSLQLKTKPQATVREKLMSLAFLFQLQLSAVSALSTLQYVPGRRPCKSEIIVAGYDPDGKARIGRARILTVPFNLGFKSQILERSINEVGEKIVSQLAGEIEIADKLLREPELGKDDPALVVYAKSVRENEGRSLTIPEMRALASRLAEYTAKERPTVGGEDQIAELNDGRISHLKHPPFGESRKALVGFSLVVETYIGGTDPPMVPAMSEGAIVFPPGKTLLFVRTAFDHVLRRLDGNYFFQDTFKNCSLRYDGGPFHFDSENQVRTTSLVLGPKVDRADQAVQDLLNNFQWNGVSILQPAEPAQDT
jgi:hypothetical protein